MDGSFPTLREAFTKRNFSDFVRPTAPADTDHRATRAQTRAALRPPVEAPRDAASHAVRVATSATRKKTRRRQEKKERTGKVAVHPSAAAGVDQAGASHDDERQGPGEGDDPAAGLRSKRTAAWSPAAHPKAETAPERSVPSRASRKPRSYRFFYPRAGSATTRPSIISITRSTSPNSR